jgi:hypothetical protein
VAFKLALSESFRVLHWEVDTMASKRLTSGAALVNNVSVAGRVHIT